MLSVTNVTGAKVVADWQEVGAQVGKHSILAIHPFISNREANHTGTIIFSGSN